MIKNRLKTDIRNKLVNRPNANFLGVDLSFSSTGIVHLTGDGLVDSFTITTSPNSGSYTARIAYIRDGILSILDKMNETENSPALVTMEGYALGVKGGMTFTMGELGGVVKEAFRARGKDVLLVPPMVLKKFIGAAGTGKELVRLELFKKYGIEFETSDETDACVLAIMGLNWYYQNVSKGLILKYQEESLSKCEHLSFNRARPKNETVAK